MTITLAVLYLMILVVGYWLRILNLRHLKKYGSGVPKGFESVIDSETLRRSASYTLDLGRTGLAESLLANLAGFIFLFGAGIGLYDRWVGSLTGSFVGAGIIFFLLLATAEALLDVPFSLYRTFCIEARYGFNTMTLRLWFTDVCKSAAIATVLLVLVTAGGLALVCVSPSMWWFWVWIFFAILALVLMYLSPYVIEPLFFTFKPVSVAGLEEEIRLLMGRAGLAVSKVMEVDASRRSTHSNAYFTGIGRVKRIVLYDTLLHQMTHGEVVAVLAHEVGHWKRRHILKRLITTELTALIACYLAFRLTGWGGLGHLLGLERASFTAQLVIAAFLGSLAAFPLTPLSHWLSRRHEREADRFAAALTGNPEALASALVKLSRENLANLHPHPFYAAFHYSHPPVVERVAMLRGMETGRAG